MYETTTNVVSVANTDEECKKLSQIIGCQMKSECGILKSTFVHLGGGGGGGLMKITFLISLTSLRAYEVGEGGD